MAVSTSMCRRAASSEMRDRKGWWSSSGKRKEKVTLDDRVGLPQRVPSRIVQRRGVDREQGQHKGKEKGPTNSQGHQLVHRAFVEVVEAKEGGCFNDSF